MIRAPSSPAALPLTGCRILILRSRQQSSALADQLRALGATPILIPVLEIAPPSETQSLDRALVSLASYDWLLFTSANAVTVVSQRLSHLGLRLSRLPRLAAIGPSTAAALQETGLSTLAPAPPLLPPTAIAESLAETLLPEITRLLAEGKLARLLLVRAEHARDLLPDRLTAAGAHITIATAYRNVIPEASASSLAALFASPETWPHAIPFTSSSTVTHLLNLLQTTGLGLPSSVPRVSIGPITSATLREHGLHPHAEAAMASVTSLVEAIHQLLVPNAHEPNPL